MDDATQQTEQESRDRLLDSFAGDIMNRHLGTPLSLRHQPDGPARILQFAGERIQMMDDVRGRWNTTGQPSWFSPLVWRWKTWRRQFGQHVPAEERPGAEPQADAEIPDEARMTALVQPPAEEAETLADRPAGPEAAPTRT